MSVHTTRLALLGAAILLLNAGSAWAGPLYSWNWSFGDAGSVSHDGGRINWIQSTFDTNTNRLAWYGNFGDGSALRTDGFTLALRTGASPRNVDGEVVQIFFDAKKNVSFPGQIPVLTAYGYNGLGDFSSYLDGAPGGGIQTPDRIASSALPGVSDWVHDLVSVGNGDGSRTIGFDIDVSALIGHQPLWPGSGDWTGTGYGESIGAYMQTFATLNSRYEDGYLSYWNRASEGHLEVSSAPTETVTDPVPEPATLTLLGLGVAGLFGSRFRRRSTV